MPAEIRMRMRVGNGATYPADGQSYYVRHHLSGGATGWVIPHILFPAILDQLFICHSASMSAGLVYWARWSGPASARRTFELVFAHVDGGGRVGHIGDEIVYHLCTGGGRDEEIGELVRVGWRGWPDGERCRWARPFY